MLASDADEALPKLDQQALRAWLSTSTQSFAPIRSIARLAPPPDACRVLLIEPIAVSVEIALGATLGRGSEVLLLLSEAEWRRALELSAELSALDWETGLLAYEAPWFQDARALDPAVARPIATRGATPWGAEGARVVVCLVEGGVLDARAGPHVLGFFDRVLDRGGFARAQLASRCEYGLRLSRLLAPADSKALVVSAERGVQGGFETLLSSEDEDTLPSPCKRARKASAGHRVRSVPLRCVREAFESRDVSVQHAARSVRLCNRTDELWTGHVHLLLKPAAGKAMPPLVPACPCCR
jgi:hypothetical protein